MIVRAVKRDAYTVLITGARRQHRENCIDRIHRTYTSSLQTVVAKFSVQTQGQKYYAERRPGDSRCFMKEATVTASARGRY
jgi:hypothetical protein